MRRRSPNSEFSCVDSGAPDIDSGVKGDSDPGRNVHVTTWETMHQSFNNLGLVQMDGLGPSNPDDPNSFPEMDGSGDG